MHVLEVCNLTKNFGGLTAVNNLSFTVNQGDIVALIGPNGAGKTTVFNLISGFLKPTAGNIFLFGHPIVGKKPHVIAKLNLSRTFQIVQPFLGLTVQENVTTGAFNSVSDTIKAQKIALEVIDKVGLSHISQKKASSITLADRKRLEVAKTLATGAKILLLDEVMAGLTPKEMEGIIQLVKDINQGGISILLIEHNLKAVVKLAGNVIVINYGTKIAEGLPKDVLANEEVIVAYVGKEANFVRRK
jgi:branched-chain amino acid transport system ATP-binding protein